MKIIKYKIKNKYRLLSILSLILILILGNTAYFITYGDHLLEFINDSDYKESGIYGNTVYVNDLENDYYYYTGLNYTENDGTLPTTENKNIYNDSNLIQVKITYSSTNIENNQKGYVSLTERQDTYIYYKTLVVNTNNTTDTSDDYVIIDLIDNPFTDRPNGMGFNGWTTNYQKAALLYDNDYYERKAKIPVTYKDGKPEKLEITFNANWIEANVELVNNNFNNAISNLYNNGMKKLEVVTYVYGDLDMKGYFHSVELRYNDSFSGYYNSSGVLQTSGSCRSFFSTCKMYEKIESEVFDENAVYYQVVNGTMTEVDNSKVERPINEVIIEPDYQNKNMSNYFEKIELTRNEPIDGYYDANGNYNSSGTCNSNTCEYYRLINYYKNSGEEEIFDYKKNYYYLVTKDINILVLNQDTSNTWNSSATKDFTLTGINNGSSYNATWNANSAVNCYSNVTIENLIVYYNGRLTNYNPPSGTTASGVLFGRYHNVKIGRGIGKNGTRPNFRAIVAGNGSTTGRNNNPTKYKLVVESGIYSSISLSTGASNYGSSANYINNKSVYGNDYDRVKKDNTNLDIYYCASGSWGNNIYSTNSSTTNNDYAFDLNVLSGTIGSSKYDYTTGIYVGGRYGGTHYAPTRIKVDGGYIYNLIGGPLVDSSRSSRNATSIYMTGGEVDIIIGGAGETATYGNRIIDITGGTVNYSVFGGSNGYQGSNGDGTVNGSSYIYVGGKAIIGKEEYINNNSKIYGASAGNVFGIGNGKSGSSTIGSNDNSTIIIDELATINENVYGGGNYGATGVSSTSNTSKSTIIINNGLINGSVYGGGKSNGAGSVSKNTAIDIKMYNGTVAQSIYGGSDDQGKIYGSVSIGIYGGEIGSSVYGGGRGGISGTKDGTYVRDDINITIGDNQSKYTPIINESVYGGSAYGTVNGITNSQNVSSTNTTVTINKGIINNVYGGGQGNETYTPYVLGNATVTINDGTINNVYGGNDKSGTPNGKLEVYLNGGTVTNTFGGGNETSAKETNVYLQGGTSNKIFGGSNLKGEVSQSNVTTTSGNANTIYGGNNQGGTTTVTNVIINGGKINTVYGGGESASVTDNTSVTLKSTVENIFGGSNLQGDVPTTNIYIESGFATNIYGGNNQGGIAKTTNINFNGGYSKNVYGGGLKAETETTNVNAYYGSIDNLYGSGNEAGTTKTTNVSLGSTKINKVYGGANMSGSVPDSYIKNLNSNVNESIQLNIGYSQSDQHNSQATDYKSSEKISVSIKNNSQADITTWSLYILTSKGFIGNNWSSAKISEISLGYYINQDNQYWGTNPITANNTFEFDFHIHSEVEYNDFKIYGYYFIGTDSSGNKYVNQQDLGDIYGGNNQGGKTDNTHINLTLGNIQNIYGGGKKATTKTSSIDIKNTNIYGNIYGGGDEAPIDTVTMNISSSTIGTSSVSGNIYGGGNLAEVNNDITLVVEKNTNVNGNIYGGGNLGKVLGKIDSTIKDSNITKDIYGAGNKASVGTAVTADTISLKVNNVTATSIYGGGNAAETIGNTTTAVSKSSIENIYGGGNGAESIVSGDTTGEQNLAKVNGNTTTIVEDNTKVTNIFGGGNLGMVIGNTNVKTYNITATSIYGGGNEAIVDKNTKLLVSSTKVNNSIYAGGNGAKAIVKGNTNLDIENNTNVTNHVFGGGNASETGTKQNNNSTGVVNIAGATVGKNVYGGANTSTLYGITTVNIGANAITNKNLIISDINIGGTVFGGGEANASGSENYDFSFISVTKGININIDAKNHTSFNINGSIFGSGNASSTEGFSYINIKNYGTKTSIKRNISIQRATTVTLDNSYIALAGATDRTNEYSNVLFTLSRVDELKLKNSSSLYLRKGANLLKKFNSVVDIDGEEVTSQVTIDPDSNALTRNTNNRVYMYAGENLNIAKDESVTVYGDVVGMTFFGMYSFDRNDNIITAMYDDYNNGQAISSGDLYYFDNGSYVLGKHSQNHDITKDGFYSNYGNESVDAITIKYIEPTPADTEFYMWSIGEVVASYEISLTASKYSTLGAQEVPLINHTSPNTTFSVLGVSYSALDPNIKLVDYTKINKIAKTDEEADTTFGLNMKSGQTGWLVNGSTNFVTEGDIAVTGTKDYLRENLNNVPALVFYLYHSKNLINSGDMGSVTISLAAVTPIDDLNNEVERINIVVNLSKALYNTNDYEGTITQGKKYEMFATNKVNITARSSFSTYYSLYMNSDKTPYKEGYHRSLVSSFVFPVDTTITMIDLHDQDNPIYYYYVIKQEDYDNSLIEYNRYGETSYQLSKFVKMGSTSSSNNYNDEYYNSIYYNNNIAEEEFIFNVDFKEANILNDVTDASLLIELRSADEQTLISVLGIEQQTLKYNVYTQSNAAIEIEGTNSKNPLYQGQSTDLTIYSNFVQQKKDSNTVYDTTFEDEKLGIKISIYDSNNNLLSAQDLFGINFEYNGNKYFPSGDGTTRIKIADKIANAKSKIKINTEKSKLSSGEYTILIESFGSYDGIYYESENDVKKLEIKVKIIDTPYGLKTSAKDEFMFIDKITGHTSYKNNVYTFTTEYLSELPNANLRVKLQRRNYDSIYNNIYVDVDLADYINQTLPSTNKLKEYTLSTNPVNKINYTFNFKENLKTGTYRLVVMLYDDNNYIGETYNYIIIK